MRKTLLALVIIPLALAGCAATSSTETLAPATTSNAPAPAPASKAPAPAPSKAAPVSDGTHVDGDWRIGKVVLKTQYGTTTGTLRVTNVVGDPRSALFTVTVLVGGDAKGTLSGAANTVAPGQTVTVTLLGTDPLPKGAYTTEVQVDSSF